MPASPSIHMFWCLMSWSVQPLNDVRLAGHWSICKRELWPSVMEHTQTYTLMLDTRQMLPYPTSPLVSLFTFYLHIEHTICINDWFQFQFVHFYHVPNLFASSNFCAKVNKRCSFCRLDLSGFAVSRCNTELNRSCSYWISASVVSNSMLYVC